MTWNDTFRAALVEVDPNKLLVLIHEAEVAMTARSKSSQAASTEELQAIGDAIWTLQILKSHTLAGSVLI